jgi:hypothetical protein
MRMKRGAGIPRRSKSHRPMMNLKKIRLGIVVNKIMCEKFPGQMLCNKKQ